MLIFLLFEKKFWGDLGEFGAGDSRTLESGDSAFAGMGRGGEWGKGGNGRYWFGGCFFGGVFIWCFFWDVSFWDVSFLGGSFWGVGGVRMRVRGAKTKQLPIPAKAGISRLTGAGRATPRPAPLSRDAVRALPAHRNREIPAFAGMGEGAGMEVC